MPAADWNLCGRGQDLLTVRQPRAVCESGADRSHGDDEQRPRRDEQDGLCPLRCPRRGLSENVFEKGRRVCVISRPE
jgi:hypothetical protein